MKSQVQECGFALIATLLMLSVLLALLGAYTSVTRVELATTKSYSDSARGFFAAEAGLNLRAEGIRLDFLGYNRPSGNSPSDENPCAEGNRGSGDFACENHDVGNRDVVTYMEEDPTNPVILTIPPGERYQNLNAQEYRYTAFSSAKNALSAREEAILELHFKSRLVPLFQFAAFYNKDLEILPGPKMTLNGPVHTNGDLYLNSDTGLDVTGQVTTGGDLYRGRKNTNVCNSTPVRIANPTTLTSMVPSCSTRTKISKNALPPWNGMVQINVEEVTVPEPEVLDPTSGQVYWEKADLRLVLNLNSTGNVVTTNSLTGVEVRNSDDTVDTVAQPKLDACAGSISGRVANTTYALYNNREGKTIRMLELDVQALFNCVHSSQLFGASKYLDDDTEGGIVLYLTVKGPNSSEAANGYGVRVRNAQTLQSNQAGARVVKGITFVSDQAAYVMGNFNSTNKIPAAVLCDSFNVLSGAWNDANSTLSLSNRIPTNTTQNLAVLAGTDTTGDTEGSGGQGGAYNGGLENYPRFHEKWSGKTYTYSGSFVSLNQPRHVAGTWVYGGSHYEAPTRVWSYDTSFNDAAKLPPITPRFVYLRQELFVRDFERD